MFGYENSLSPFLPLSLSLSRSIFSSFYLFLFLFFPLSLFPSFPLFLFSSLCLSSSLSFSLSPQSPPSVLCPLSVLPLNYLSPLSFFFSSLTLSLSLTQTTRPAWAGFKTAEEGRAKICKFL